MVASDPQICIAQLEQQLYWAQLKIEVLDQRLRQQRIKMLGPRSESLSDLQLELLADEEPGVSRGEVEAEARRERMSQAPPRQAAILEREAGVEISRATLDGW